MRPKQFVANFDELLSHAGNKTLPAINNPAKVFEIALQSAAAVEFADLKD